MKRMDSRSGQAMVEFLLGLTGIIVILMALNLAASIVYNDFNTIYSAREEVADNLVAGVVSSSAYNENQSYDPSTSIEALREAIIEDSEYDTFIEDYSTGTPDGFAFLSEGSDPLSNMTGVQKSSSIDVTAPLFQRILGRASVNINNAVWMPPWEDLMQ